MIHLKCACGAELAVVEMYAGGQVLCHACGATISVPSDWAAEERFRFQCPHCQTRVVARRTSAGKKSQCPACEQIYVVPEPPLDPNCAPPADDRRFELNTDDLALRFGLPFPVGKLEPTLATPPQPQPRYLHSPTAPHEGDCPPLPDHVLPGNRVPGDVLPGSHVPGDADRVSDRPGPERSDGERPDGDRSDKDGGDSTILQLSLDMPSLSMGIEPRAATFPPSASLAGRGVGDRPPGTQRPGFEESPASWRQSSSAHSSSAPTAAAIPLMSNASKPASVGELQVLSGACSGTRIRLDFHRFVVGAERDCDLRPPSPRLSRHHCVFKKDEYSLRIRDLGSTNGTFVNGRRIFSEAILKPGDEVTIADVKFHVLLPRAPQVVHSMPDSAPSISDFVIL